MASLSVAVLHDEREIGILEQERMSATGACIGVLNDELSHTRSIAIEVGKA